MEEKRKRRLYAGEAGKSGDGGDLCVAGGQNGCSLEHLHPSITQELPCGDRGCSEWHMRSKMCLIVGYGMYHGTRFHALNIGCRSIVFLPFSAAGDGFSIILLMIFHCTNDAVRTSSFLIASRKSLRLKKPVLLRSYMSNADRVSTPLRLRVIETFSVETISIYIHDNVYSPFSFIYMRRSNGVYSILVCCTKVGFNICRFFLFVARC